MRNILAHDYGAVDLERVYTVIIDYLPDLIKRVNDLISTLERDVGWKTDK
jgi:uncharacterized protein with HEPN domain